MLYVNWLDGCRWRKLLPDNPPIGDVVYVAWKTSRRSHGWVHGVIDRSMAGNTPIIGGRIGGRIIYQSDRPDYAMFHILRDMNADIRHALVLKVGSISLACLTDKKFRHMLENPVTAAVAVYADLPEYITRNSDT